MSEKSTNPNADPLSLEVVSDTTKCELLGANEDKAGASGADGHSYQFLQSPDPDIKIEVTHMQTEAPELPATAGTLRRTFYKDDKPSERQETFYKLVRTPDKTLEIERTMTHYDIETRHAEQIAEERTRHAKFIKRLRSGDRDALEDIERERRERSEKRDLDIEATRRAEREFGFDLVTEQEARALIAELNASVPKEPRRYKWYSY